jgi:hypothetical protein
MDDDRTTARVLIGWVAEKNLQLVEQLVCIAIGTNNMVGLLQLQPSVHLAFSSNVQIPHPSRGVMNFWTQLQPCFLRSLFYGLKSTCQELANSGIMLY